MLVGLAGVRFGLWWADSAAALVVAVLVCVAGWRLGRRTIDTLTDVAPPGAAAKITAIADQVPGVVAVEHVRAREVGDKTFIDLDRRGEPHAAARPRQRAQGRGRRRASAAQMPGAEPTVTTDPVALDNETVLDRVMVIARNRALAVHHVTVHELEGPARRSRSIWKWTASCRCARRTRWPTGWKTRSPPSSAPAWKSKPISSRCSRRTPPAARRRPSGSRRWRWRSSEIAAEGRTIRDVHDVRVRETDDGEIVNFHCRVDPALTVQAVHEKVDALERALRERSPSIKRVIGHAEPMR